MMSHIYILVTSNLGDRDGRGRVSETGLGQRSTGSIMKPPTERAVTTERILPVYLQSSTTSV